MHDDTPASRAAYEIVTTLGQGGMARVLLTLSRGPAGVNKLLVVKELKAELKGDPEFLTMFMDEARIAAHLNHPNVIQTYQVSSDGEHPLIVMEYLEGQALSALLARVGRKDMPLDRHLYILAQTAAGLHYAHELKGLDGTPLNLVHRDVSPHNVFVTYDGLVKLVDFGIAKAAGSAGLTRAGQFKGKLGYAAPEQLGGGRGGASVDRRADIFALGVMLWEALARRRLTAGTVEGAVMMQRVEGREPSIRDAAPDAPEELLRICEKAMALDPDDRFATAAEMRAALEAWLDTSKRIGGEEVGALVRHHFAEDRRKIRSLVEERIKGRPGGAEVISDFAPLTKRAGQVVAPAERTESLTSSALVDAADTTVHAASSAASQSKAIEPRRSRGLLAVAAGAVVVAIAISAFQLQRGGIAPAADTSGSASASATARAAQAAATTIDVSISAEPAEARLFLDDAALGGNPFHATMPAGSLAHRLRVSAGGYTTEERIITLDRDIRLELSLKPAPAAAPSSVPAATPSSVPAAHASPGAGAPRGAATTTAAPAATAPAPGEALTNPNRKNPRSIDDTF